MIPTSSRGAVSWVLEEEGDRGARTLGSLGKLAADERGATWDEKKPSSKAGGAKGGLGEGPGRGSQQGQRAGSCRPHTGGVAALKSPPLLCTGRPDPG